MTLRVEVSPWNQLEDYEAVAHLAVAVRDLRAEAARVAPRLAGRTVWMVNSTSVGGGVAEMLPTMISMLRQLGIATEWVVIEAEEEEFFRITKHIHNLIHGVGVPELGPSERELYEAVNRRNAAFLRDLVRPGDILVVHDPQPMPIAGILKEEEGAGIRAVWRCHIGLDEENSATRAAWSFLEPYGSAYDRSVFSAPEYIPPFLAQHATVIYPAIDPLASKNRELNVHHVVGILVNAGLVVGPGPVLRPPFPALVHRLQHDGRFIPAILPEDIGLLNRPIITQVSRWDRLKGWAPLLEGFVRLKRFLIEQDDRLDPLHHRRLSLVRLVLAGPDPASIQDDPEGLEVVEELRAAYLALHPAVQNDVAVIALPMVDTRQNALMVNALQRASSLVVQNSLREGFGLTVTEAMWKRVPILTNTRACGPRHQVRDGIDGRLIADPENREELAMTMDAMLGDPDAREAWGRNAQRHVHDKFLVFRQIQSWLRVLERLV